MTETDHRPYILAVAAALDIAGLAPASLETSPGRARIELQEHEDARVALHWHEVHGWEWYAGLDDDEAPEDLHIEVVDPPVIVVAALIDESWTVRSMLRAKFPDDRASALAAYAPTVKPEPTGPRPGRKVTDGDSDTWTYIDIGRKELFLALDLEEMLEHQVFYPASEATERYGPMIPLRDVEDVELPAEGSAG